MKSVYSYRTVSAQLPGSSRHPQAESLDELHHTFAEVIEMRLED